MRIARRRAALLLLAAVHFAAAARAAHGTDKQTDIRTRRSLYRFYTLASYAVRVITLVHSM